MKRTERSSYTPLDFLSWRESESLILVPKFQRRGVWGTPERSYLIDTLIRGMPVPPIYLRITQSTDKKRTVREVVDGQQRVSAVLDFIDNKYSLSKSLGAPYAGKNFSQLSKSERDDIEQYSFICEVLHGTSDTEVLEIFTRLNTFSVKLNAQELRNGTYFGYFKQSAYRLAHEHIEFWRQNHIFSEKKIARMLEVEMTSELLIALLAGMQDKKSSIDDFYEKYDDNFPNRSRIESQFRRVVDTLTESMGDELRRTEFRRPPLFYTLYCTVAHREFGIPNARVRTPKRALTTSERQKLLQSTIKLSELITAAREEVEIPSRYHNFVSACLRQTDNIKPRQTRFEVVYRHVFG